MTVQGEARLNLKLEVVTTVLVKSVLAYDTVSHGKLLPFVFKGCSAS